MSGFINHIAKQCEATGSSKLPIQMSGWLRRAVKVFCEGDNENRL